jgi:cytochrome c biogenesis protein CcdA
MRAPQTQPARHYVLLALGALALGIAGYTGYVLYPRFDLPASTGIGLLVLAAAAGVASFFSPCSFPLLVSMLARPISAERDAGRRRPLRQAAGFAAALSVGASAFLLLVGLAIALGGGAAFEQVTFTSVAGRVIRGVVGASLVVLGLIQLERLAVNLRRLEPITHRFLRSQAELRRRHPVTGFVVFGFGYLLAGFG